MKSSIREMHVMLLSICELCEFLMAVRSGMMYTFTLKTIWHFTGKEHLLKSVCYIMLYTICSLVELDTWWPFGLLQGPANILQGNSPQYPLDRWLVGWTAETVWMLWGAEKSLLKKWKWVLISWASSLYSSCNTNWAACPSKQENVSSLASLSQ